MIIRGIRFNYALDQSGLRNFDGKGYPYHRYLEPLGLDFEGSSFTAKTTTLLPRRGKEYNEPGNMPLLSDAMTPAELKPKCIYVSPRSFLRGAALNAVGLAGPGIQALIDKDIWQYYPEPFTISLMSLAASLSDRLSEVEQMAKILSSAQPFASPFGVQLNITCPNVEHEQDLVVVIKETRESLAILRHWLGDKVALTVKIHALFPVEVGVEMSEDPNCDGICNSNTIPWKDIPLLVRYKLFGTTESPLAEFGGGGLSGADHLFQLVADWVRRARLMGLTKPIIAGGGILNTEHVDILAACGASAIGVGSVAFLRPWRVQSIIKRANKLGASGKFWENISYDPPVEFARKMSRILDGT